jgi:hypothetical protein
MSSRARASLLAPFLVVCACAHTPDGSRSAQTTTTGATSFTLPSLPGQSSAANRLGTATCQRKQECDEIGEDKFYASPQACLTSTVRHANDDLDRLSCENGLDDQALEVCVHTVRAAECTALESLASVDACSPQRLCAR